MSYEPAAKISISLPPDLLRQVDELARRDYSYRSDIIRQALLEYTRKPENDIEEMDMAKEALKLKRADDNKRLDKVRAKYPMVDPGDNVLLEILYEQEEKSGPSEV